MRWDPYILARGKEFTAFWSGHLERGDRSVLFIVGKGFDPRAMEAVEAITENLVNAQLWLLAFDNGLLDSTKRISMTNANLEKIEARFDPGAVKFIDVEIDTSSQRNATATNTMRALHAAGDLGKFDDVVIDISAMPRMVAMTTIATVLYNLDRLHLAGGTNVNVHVTTAESLAIDRSAGRGSLSDSVTSVAGFYGALKAQSDEHHPRLWFPFLAPDIVEAIVKGRQPLDLTSEKLKRLGILPMDWQGQREALSCVPAASS